MNERPIRVDFSKTESAHNPTPGFYNGKPIEEYRREYRGSERFQDRSRFRRDDRDDRSYRGGGYSRQDTDRHYVPRRGRSRSRSISRDRRDRHREYRREEPREYRREEPREYRRDEPREFRRRSLSPRN